MPNPSITCLIPVYNKEPYLEAALASATSQSYANKQVIVVDDHSTDGSWELLQALLAKYSFQLHRTPAPRQGPYWIYNYVMRRYPADYYGLIDADDLWLPDALQRLLAFASSQQAEIVGGQVELIDHAGKPFDHPHSIRRFLPYNVNKYMDIYGSNGLINSAHIWSHQAVKQVGYYDDSTVCGADSEYIFRAQAAGVQIRNLPSVVCQVRIIENSLTTGQTHGLHSNYRQQYHKRVLAPYRHERVIAPENIEFFKAERTLQPKNPDLLFRYIEYLRQLGQAAAARKLLPELMQLETGLYPWRWGEMVRFLELNAAQNKLPRACFAAKLSLALAGAIPDNPKPLLAVALCPDKVATFVLENRFFSKHPPRLLVKTGRLPQATSLSCATHSFSDPKLSGKSLISPPLPAQEHHLLLITTNHTSTPSSNIKSLIADSAPAKVTIASPLGVRNYRPPA